MKNTYLQVEQSPPLHGQVSVFGAKNAVLCIMASTILTDGVTCLTNVPASSDVLNMISLLEHLGARVEFHKDNHELCIDTSSVHNWIVPDHMMKKMRASILVMGPLLARFGQAHIALPGGCVIGARPIDYHLKNLSKMGVRIEIDGEYVRAIAQNLESKYIILEYPSVGATENILMSCVLTAGSTHIVNAALEPEVLDLIKILKKMGANIKVIAPATIKVDGVSSLSSVHHSVLPDRLEAGALLLAGAITGGQVTISNVHHQHLDVFLEKLREMGHSITTKRNSITLKASNLPRAVSFKTGPFPNFPTDLQAPMMAIQCIAEGVSTIEELVFENRLVHARELSKMGAQIKVEHTKATVTGVEELYGTHVIATDIRASCALVLAGLVAKGKTKMTGIHHWQRGYESLEKKLAQLGGHIELVTVENDETWEQHFGSTKRHESSLGVTL